MTTERYESSPRDTQEIERLEASLCDLCLPRVIMFKLWNGVGEIFPFRLHQHQTPEFWRKICADLPS